MQRSDQVGELDPVQSCHQSQQQQHSRFLGTEPPGGQKAKAGKLLITMHGPGTTAIRPEHERQRPWPVFKSAAFERRQLASPSAREYQTPDAGRKQGRNQGRWRLDATMEDRHLGPGLGKLKA